MIVNDDFTLERQLSFIMYACSKETIKRYQPFLKKQDLTYTQYLTLLVLWNKDEMTLKQLGEELYLDSGTMTPIIKKLESKNLVSKRRDDNDGRNVIISITADGLAIKDKMKGIPQAILKQTGFNQEDAQEVLTLLTSILDKVKL